MLSLRNALLTLVQAIGIQPPTLQLQDTNMTDIEFFQEEIKRWKGSPERIAMLQGAEYYQGKQDILKRRRTAIGNDGDEVEIKNLPNNRVVDNQYAKMVDQKANYLVGKPITFDAEDNKTAADTLKKVLGRDFQRTLRGLGADSINGGVGWLHPYYDEDGVFRMKRFPPYEILPFWSDAEHTKLECAVRLYLVEEYQDHTLTIVERVEIYTKQGVFRFTLDGGVLYPDGEHYASPYLTVQDRFGTLQAYNWDKIPLVAFKFNALEQPLIRRIKCLQDGLNELLSDFQNNMQEDSRHTILVLKNYDGTDLGEFRQNLSTLGVIKVRTEGTAQGGVETLQIEVSAENYNAILNLFKKAIIENARGYDAKDERLTSGQANRMNIQSMYSDIDLDANEMEAEYQAAFEQLLWFINQHLQNTGKASIDPETVEVIFNRDMLVNESEIINDIRASVGLLSQETLVAQHPYVSDTEKELARIKAEQQAAVQQQDSYDGAYGHEHGEGLGDGEE